MPAEFATCPLCLSTSEPRLEPDKTWLCGFRGAPELVRCVDCSLVYLRSYELDGLETRSEDYVRAKIVESCNQLAEQDELFMRRLAWAKGQLQGRRVLDIGCGNGAFLLAAREAGWQPSGLDDSDTARELLTRTGIAIFVADAVEFLREHPASFDFIHMNHSLEHIPQASETVIAARAALAPGGLLYVEVPNEFDNLVYRVLEVIGRRHERGSVFGRSRPQSEPSPHLYFFNKKSLTRLAERAGFASFEVNARRREPFELNAAEVAAGVSALLGAGPFLTLTARVAPA
jgi:SAM-dependent methyltransferase